MRSDIQIYEGDGVTFADIERGSFFLYADELFFKLTNREVDVGLPPSLDMQNAVSINETPKRCNFKPKTRVTLMKATFTTQVVQP